MAITVESVIGAPVDVVWERWNGPEHIVHWAFADETWEAPHAENDLREGGEFKTRMQAKDGSEGFDFAGTYTAVVPHERIEYVMDDGRKVATVFENLNGKTKVTQTFDPENKNPEEMQAAGWQAILDNFKKYTEAK